MPLGMQYDRTIKKFHETFTPTPEEEMLFVSRLEKYSEEELTNLEANFAFFGVDEVLACVFGCQADCTARGSEDKINS